MTERIRTKAACEITGLGIRQLQAMSARGEIPGAAKLGRTWTYNVARLRAWLEEREGATCRPICTSGVAFGGGAFRSAEGISDERYERALGLRP